MIVYHYLLFISNLIAYWYITHWERPCFIDIEKIILSPDGDSLKHSGSLFPEIPEPHMMSVMLKEINSSIDYSTIFEESVYGH